MLLVLWSAYTLRLIGIDQQSIWYDEGLSIYYARGSVGDVLRGISKSEHPPLHSLLLHLWTRMGGESELSVRLLSAWWGVLAVALLIPFGRRLPSESGILAALLLAASPFAIWFSQETRGYTMALALVIATVDVALDLFPALLESRVPAHNARWPHYILYVTLATVALYTHLYSAFVLVALNLAFAAQQVRSRGNLARAFRWLEAQVAILALFAPWLPFVAAQWRLNATYWHGAVDWKQIVSRTLVAFSVGETLEGPWAVGATWALVLLAVLGTLALSWRRGTRLFLLTLWLWILVPFLFQIALNRNLPKFAPRYLMNALPAFLLLASAGTLWLFEIARRYAFSARGWTAMAGLLLVTAVTGGATARSLANHYLDERFYRPDLRAVTRYIDAHATPNDLIVLVSGHSYPAFTYYYRGPLPVLPLPDRLLPDTRTPIDVCTLRELDQAIAGRHQLWLVLWQPSLADPTGLITDTLEHTYHRLGVGRTFHDVALLLFDVSPGPRLAQSTTPQSPLLANFDGKVRLLGYSLPRQAVQPGGTLYLYLYWESMSEMDHDYKAFAQILDDKGHIVAQHDKVAGAEAYPTSHWPSGALVRDRSMLTVRPEATPGQYRLIVGLYKPSRNMPRLSVQGQGARGDHVLLSEIEVRGK